MGVEANRAYFDFINSISSEQTKKAYKQNLIRFMKFCKVEVLNGLEIDMVKSVDNLLKIDLERSIIDYVVSQKDKIAYSTIHVLLAPIYHFCDMSDIHIHRKKIKKYMGEKKKVVNDRPYTREEIARLLNVADIRMKPILLLMASGGIRVGSIPELRLNHLKKLDKYNLYKITVYENSTDEYFTFCTPECAKAIDDYLDYRTRNGENLTPESYLIRLQFDINDLEQVRNFSEPVQRDTLSTLINLTTIKAGLRQTNHGTKKERKEVALTDGFRKFFTNQLLESGIVTEHRWLLEGHDLENNDPNYVRQQEMLLNEYLKAVNNLTINEENRLKIKVQTLLNEKTNYEKLDAKIEALQRYVYQTQTLVYNDRPYDTPIRTLEPSDMQNPPPDKRRMTEDEIEHQIKWERTKRNARRHAEKKLLHEIEQEEEWLVSKIHSC